MDIKIAEARSCESKKWHNRVLKWTEFVQKLSNTYRTSETLEEFKIMNKKEKGRIKNCKGGFVGGKLKEDGPRNKSTIETRDLLTLDIDHCQNDIWPTIEKFGKVCCMYSTHSHRADNVRLRLIIPLDRDVKPEEYEAISRMVAYKIGIEIFDTTTHQPERLMYWPSTPIDGEYVFEQVPFDEGEVLKADGVLSEYTFGWSDMESWPKSIRENNIIKTDVKEQQDPTTKSGLIGAFCRTYTITDAVKTFLSDLYSLSDDGTRATYKSGTTSNGVLIFDNTFSYSYHDSDPTQGILCNAFDLVRIHLYGEEDKEVKSGTKTENLPSFKKMIELCVKDEKVQREKLEEEFGDYEGDIEWLTELTRTAKGSIAKTIDNIVKILQNDCLLKDNIYFDTFEQLPKIKSKLPWSNVDFEPGSEWSDFDDSGLRWYLEKHYAKFSAIDIKSALDIIQGQNTFHPIREYLTSLLWDGEQRAERLFIDYLGAEDTPYNRMVTKKMLVAAVKRVFEPGCKYEELVILVSTSQGVGKSTILSRLGKQWFSDSLTFNHIKTDIKRAIEQTEGSWIIEIGELKGLSSSDADAIKAFMSGKVDKTRKAYDRRVSKVPRQFIIVGTTNNEEFLSDRTGNRRYLPIKVAVKTPQKDVFNIGDYEIDQVWAEAYSYYQEGYETYLNSRENKLAEEQQELYMYAHDDELEFKEYLDKPILAVKDKDWYSLPLVERISYLYPEGEFLGEAKEGETEIRDKICIKAVYEEFIQEVQPEKSREGLSREVENEIKTLLIRAGWRKYDKSRGRMRFGAYGLKTAYVKSIPK
ncbi:Virulence-associated protein E [Hathewaya proteolytica DSM 3090]|uniref:Virulence-associated protein E n=1 Tax=Hathewaya proteolytica DSM 3090 TaxID=1121331 RepID=A0A1M6NUH0_9CLOT|nr:virulence-associated E family protein [Hathewaya proteolytica]SHJ99389.1 Virulence-associated protein E [Hathewaya proteolytica DSM 3090]